MKRDELLRRDLQLSDRLRFAESPGPLRTFSAILAHSGDSWFWGLGLVAVWLLGNGEWRARAIAFLLGIGWLAALVMMTKFTVRRPRPAGEWGTVYRSADPHSFPSGHAARSFLLAILATALGPAWLAAVLWVWAPLVALARVVMGLHYVSDVIAGVAIGILSALIWLQFQAPVVAWVSRLLEAV